MDQHLQKTATQHASSEKPAHVTVIDRYGLFVWQRGKGGGVDNGNPANNNTGDHSWWKRRCATS